MRTPWLTIGLLLGGGPALMAQAIPRAPYLTRMACPGECCQLGGWVALQRTPVFRAARDTTTVAFVLQAGDSVVADSSELWADRIGLVTVPARGARLEEWDPVPAPPPSPGDTLYLVGYLGEGFWDARYRGAAYAVPGFWPDPGNAPDAGTAPGARLLTPVETQWWVHLRRPAGDAGWLWYRFDYHFEGVDSCG